MVEKEKELQERVEQMDAEIKRLERQNAELDQKMKRRLMKKEVYGKRKQIWLLNTRRKLKA